MFYFQKLKGLGSAVLNSDLNATNVPTQKTTKGSILCEEMFLSYQSVGHVEHDFQMAWVGMASLSS